MRPFADVRFGPSVALLGPAPRSSAKETALPAKDATLPAPQSPSPPPRPGWLTSGRIFAVPGLPLAFLKKRVAGSVVEMKAQAGPEPTAETFDLKTI